MLYLLYWIQKRALSDGGNKEESFKDLPPFCHSQMQPEEQDGNKYTAKAIVHGCEILSVTEAVNMAVIWAITIGSWQEHHYTVIRAQSPSEMH